MESFTGKKVLITGINGFMGSHLAHALTQAGAEVHGLVRNPASTPYLEWNSLRDRVKLARGDIRDSGALDKCFAAQEYTHIFHLASQSDTWKSATNTLETFEVNVNGTLHLLEAVRRSSQNPRIVIGGSVRVFQYGKQGAAAGEEVGVIHPYDASKIAAEVMASSYFHTYGINGGIARNTNGYGPNDFNFFRLIPMVMKGALVDGTIRLRGDGKLKRDFMYVEDAVSGMKTLAEKLSHEKFRGKAYTFATGKSHSVREIVDIVQKNTKKPVSVEWDTKNPLRDRDQLVADITATRSELGWEPQTTLENGIVRTLKWYEAYFAKNGGKKA